VKIEDFKDKHKGEEMIVICNGNGLKNIPFAFLESRPNFAINFFTHWTPWLKIDYWAGTDARVFEMIEHETLKGIPKFLPAYIQLKEDEVPEENDEIVYYKFTDRIPGFVNVTRGHGLGLRYSTTAIACAHLAHYMGSPRVFVVGFDCTLGLLVYEHHGLSQMPHYYDRRDHPSEHATAWDRQFGFFNDWLDGRMEIINLSTPTMCETLPRADVFDFWRPE
jgi:hypothetical protein